MQLTLIRHMTVRIELDGITLLTDPWFGPRGWLERRLAPDTLPVALTPDEIGPLDALLVSHHHLDHLDQTALALARRLGCAFVGSPGAARRAERAGLRTVIALRRGEQTMIGPLVIHAVPAEHPLAGDAVGFVLAGSQTGYFSGDTRLTPGLVTDLKPFSLDVALVQAACAHYPLLGWDGMSLAEVTEFARLVRPRWIVPLHLHCAGKWLDRTTGLRIRADNTAEVYTALEQWMNSLETEDLAVKVLSPGESWMVAPRDLGKEKEEAK